MVFDITSMTVRNSHVLDHVRRYLRNVSGYPNFDADMLLRVYVDSFGDFCAFEAVDYMLGFVSQKHKFNDFIKSRYEPIIVKFTTFQSVVDAL